MHCLVLVFQEMFSRVSFGFAILSALLDEMNYMDEYATRLNIPLEAHVHMQTRFQVSHSPKF